MSKYIKVLLVVILLCLISACGGKKVITSPGIENQSDVFVDLEVDEVALILSNLESLGSRQEFELEQGDSWARLYRGADYGTDWDEIRIDKYFYNQEPINDTLYCPDLVDEEYFLISGFKACGVDGIYLNSWGEIEVLPYNTTARVFYKNLVVNAVSSHVFPGKPVDVSQWLAEIVEALKDS